MKRLLGVIAALAVGLTITASFPPEFSPASFTSDTPGPGNRVSAATVASYLRLWSESTDPAGLTGYGIKRLSNPAVPAATGSDGSLSASLGAFKQGGSMDRVLTLEARNPLPVPSITVTASVVAGTALLGPATIAPIGATGGTSSVTLTVGGRRQVNLVIPKLPGNNIVQTSTLVLTVTYPGFTGSFYAYRVPLGAWDGNGTGP